MFVSTRRFEARMDYMEREYKDLQNRYWELRHSHYRLLEHLGVNEVELPRKVVLIAKGGPEPSEA